LVGLLSFEHLGVISPPAAPDGPIEVKHLLIVFHSQTGHTETLASAIAKGALDDAVVGIEVRLRRAAAASVADLLWADALILGTPENFGYMSGGMKDFLDRVYYPCEGLREGLPYAIVISAGNDGSGAVTAIQRIARGFPFKEMHPPIIIKGPPTPAAINDCSELGLAVAAGLELGVY
jgi:multimeric flavodoxin WrbA